MINPAFYNKHLEDDLFDEHNLIRCYTQMPTGSQFDYLCHIIYKDIKDVKTYIADYTGLKIITGNMVDGGSCKIVDLFDKTIYYTFSKR